MKKQDILQRLKEIAPSTRLPSDMGFSINDKQLTIEISAKGVIANMQQDSTCFEGWSICVKALLGELVEKVSLKWESANEEDNKHYNRFLYRVCRFKEMYDWFDYDDPKGEIDNFMNRFVGATNNVALKESQRPQHKCEAQVEYDIVDKYKQEFMHRFQLDHLRQHFPVGVSGFPGGNSAIDLIGFDKDLCVFNVFELKHIKDDDSSKNIKVGIISEILCYGNIINDIIRGEISPVKKKNFKFNDDLLFYNNVDKFKKIIGTLLSNQFHPLVNSDKVLKLLNANNKNIDFQFAQYNINGDKLSFNKAITIHRGINQIGGCVTEVATDSTRILIDLGQNLPKTEFATNDPMASESVIERLTNGVNAIFYTHYHGDHMGLFNYVPDTIPQYIGKIAKRICTCKHQALAKLDRREELSKKELAKINKMKELVANKPVQVGDITVTPYFISHSAYESFMFLIEADGKRILHTGDFRNHGYLGKGLMPMIEKYIGEVDVLIIEGTMLSRLDECVRHEKELQKEFYDVFRKYKNCFVVCSSTDLERLATIHSAFIDARGSAPFVCDKYQKDVFDIFTESAGKHQDKLFNFNNIKIYNNYKTDILKDGFCMITRFSFKFSQWIQKMRPFLEEADTAIVFSRWGEYINPDSKYANQTYIKYMNDFTNQFHIHTSGHASAECLAKVCSATSPRLAIIPIHSEVSIDFNKLSISEELKSKIVTTSTSTDNLDVYIK